LKIVKINASFQLLHFSQLVNSSMTATTGISKGPRQSPLPAILRFLKMEAETMLQWKTTTELIFG